MNTLTNKRIAGIDIVKTLAVFFVVCVHFFLNSKYYSAPVDSLNIVLQAYVRRIVLTAVPLFIMSTGFLEYKKLYTKGFYKKLLKVIVPYVLITLIFVVLRSFGSDTLDLKNAVKSFFDFSGINYAWYVNMYIGLFLMMPIFNAAISSLDRKAHFSVIIALIVVISLPQTLNPIVDNVEALQFIYAPNWWKSIYPVLYYFLGAYIGKYRVHMKRWLCIIEAAAIPVLDVVILYFMNKVKFNNWLFTDYGYFLCVLESLFIFMLFCNADIKHSFPKKVFQRISSITLYIYLFSTLSDKAVYKIIYNNFIDKSDISAQSEMFVRFFIPAVLSSFLLALTAALIFDICYRNLKKLIGFTSEKTGLAAFIEKKSLQREEKRKIKEEAKEKEEVLSAQ